jgi:hypothetical protein
VGQAWAFLGLIACTSGGTTSVPDAGDAGHIPTIEEVAAQLETLQRSREAWEKLVASMGETYSYTEENCMANVAGPDQAITVIQVEDGHARLSGTELIERRMCEAHVNRYDNFTPHTLPELYADCEALVRREGTSVEVKVDERGVLKACMYPGSSNCFDNCGEGFYLRTLTFGKPEVP